MSNVDRAARTRRRLLDTAWALIVERGAEVSMGEIASAVGITRQAVHVHVGSRGGLLTALVQRADERGRIVERVSEAMQVPSPTARFDACLAVWLEFVVEIHPVALDLIRLRSTDADAAAAWDDRMIDLRAMFARLTDSLSAQGALAEAWTPDQAADLLWATCSVQSWSLLVHDRGWTPDEASSALRRAAAAAVLVPR